MKGNLSRKKHEDQGEEKKTFRGALVMDKTKDWETPSGILLPYGGHNRERLRKKGA